MTSTLHERLDNWFVKIEDNFRCKFIFLDFSANCQDGCKYGECVSPNNCTCYAGYIGPDGGTGEYIKFKLSMSIVFLRFYWILHSCFIELKEKSFLLRSLITDKHNAKICSKLPTTLEKPMSLSPISIKQTIPSNKNINFHTENDQKKKTFQK